MYYPTDMSPDTLVGGKIDGRYRVEQLLDSGAFGHVYIATQLSVGRKVAIKVLQAQHLDRPEIVERFKLEMRATVRVEHRNTARVHDFGQLPDGRLYLVMEFLRGRTVRDDLRDNGPMSVARVVRIGQQVARALAAVHHHGIVHRDLKAENVMLVERYSEQDVVKLLDLGIAFVPTTGEGPRLTGADAWLGTPEYMAPELVRALECTSQSDLYALGVLLYEMLIGEVPYRATNPLSTVYQHVNDPVKDPSERADLPVALADLCLSLMAKLPKDRPHSAGAVANRLAEILQVDAAAEPHRRAPVAAGAAGQPSPATRTDVRPGGVPVSCAPGPGDRPPGGPAVAATGPIGGAAVDDDARNAMAIVVNGNADASSQPPPGAHRDAGEMALDATLVPDAATGGVKPGPLVASLAVLLAGAGAYLALTANDAAKTPGEIGNPAASGAPGRDASTAVARPHSSANAPIPVAPAPTPAPPRRPPGSTRSEARAAWDKALRRCGLGPWPSSCAAPRRATAKAVVLLRDACRGKRSRRSRRKRANKSASAVSLLAGAYVSAVVQKKYGAALADAVAASRKCDAAAGPHFIAGKAALRLGRGTEALAYLRRTTVLAPTLPAPWYELAVAQVAAGQTTAAIASLAKLRRLQPAHRRVDRLLGHALLQAGDHARATKALKRAIARAPNDALSHFLLGAAQEASGANDRAASSYCRAAELGHAAARSRCGDKRGSENP